MNLDERIKELDKEHGKLKRKKRPPEIRRSPINRNSGGLLPGLVVSRGGTYQGGRI